MADDDWKRKRDEEDEKDAEFFQSMRKSRGKPLTSQSMNIDSKEASTEKLKELMDRAEPMIEQLNSLYNMYLSGAEKFPPIERRKQLDQIMDTVTKMAKPTPALRFRFTGLQSQYMTYRDRWDKMLKDLESGKRRRAAGGGNSGRF